MPSVLLDSIMARDEPQGFYATLTAPYEPESCVAHSLGSQWNLYSTEEVVKGSMAEDPACKPQTTTNLPPHDDWGDIGTNEIEHSELLTFLDGGSTSINSGHLAGKRINYVNKLWSSSQADDCIRELALYKSAKHLKHLQGTVVPRILNISTTHAAVEVASELPHSCFWIEASPDMPKSLKQRCVEAFERLHQRGVLHGNVELCNMLIGADCKVNIIDFHRSRSSNPIPDVDVQLATPEDFDLEMRRVKFKLDYQGSRKKEHAKMFRTVELMKNNKRISRELGKWARPEDFQEPVEEDLVEPAVPGKIWSQEWLVGCDGAPRRFIVPGRSTDEFYAASDGFVACVGKMEDQKRRLSSTPDLAMSEINASKRRRDVEVASSETSSSDEGRQTTRPRRFSASGLLRSASHSSFRLALPTLDVSPLPAESQPFTSSREGSSRPKRKFVDDLLPPPTLSDLVVLAESERETKRRKYSLTSVTAEYGSDTERYFSPPPAGNDPSATTPQETSICLPVEASIVRTASSLTPKAAPPIIVRDFINKPYDGPKGYYVPYPPMENRVGMEQAKYIRMQNAQKCVQLGLRYPTVESADGEMIPQINPLPYNFRPEEEQDPAAKRRRRKPRGLGTLIRRRNKEQFGEDERRDLGLARLWEEAQHSAMSAVRFPRPLTTCVARISRSAPYEVRGILKKPAPIKVSKYQQPWKQPSDEELSPKIGPLYEEYDRSGGFGMLGVQFQYDIPRTEETMRREVIDRVMMSETCMRDEEEAWMEEDKRMEEVRREDWACNAELADLADELEVEELLTYREHTNN